MSKNSIALERGSVQLEYALVVTLIAIVSISSLIGIGQQLSTDLSEVSTAIQKANDGGVFFPRPPGA